MGRGKVGDARWEAVVLDFKCCCLGQENFYGQSFFAGFLGMQIGLNQNYWMCAWCGVCKKTEKEKDFF